MSIFKNLFNKKEETVKNYSEFWNWFQKNEQKFFEVIKSQNNIESDFLDRLAPKLAELREGFYFLTGMLDDNTAELIFTSDGNIKNIVFVEELVESAPQLKNWKFTAHKPATDIKNVAIQMAGHTFEASNIHFYPIEDTALPDKIDIVAVHDDLNEENRQEITNGTYIFLDNFLGELNFATTIGHLKVVRKDENHPELIPVEKLKDYLIWREKEFIEKYEGLRHDSENDTFSMFEVTLQSGNPLLAVINTDLLNWDRKASHPWIMRIEIAYDGSENSGMPGEKDYHLMNAIEDEMLESLKDADGYLNVGRETAEGIREIYFACKDIRKPSKVMASLREKYAGQLEMDYVIYKDKYWETFDRFMGATEE